MTARILVVDDMPLNVKLLKTKLEHEYYVVSSASNGAEAMAFIEKEPPDLILLDVMMPIMNGFEMCAQLRANAALKHIPVVMVTALSDVADRVKGLQAGADDFLTKPISDLPLMARVRSLLRLKNLMDEWRMREKTSMQFVDSKTLEDEEDIGLTGAHVLLLEDINGDRDFIVATLMEAGAQVETIGNIADAASMARTGFFDLVCASLHLAEEDALTLCAQLRSNETTRHLPIILLATDSDIARVAKGLDLGANDYLLRPLDVNELLARTRTQLRHKRHYDNLRKNYESSMALALVDPLTGAFNRRYMEAHLPRLLSRAAQSNKELSVLALDIDHFKTVNDKFLHAGGDAVLKTVVDRIQNSVRPSDLVVRMGGEEFLIVMPETPGGVAHMIAERLRTKIEAAPMLIPGFPDHLKVTVSIGYATVDGKNDKAQSLLLERADAALYKAKQEGRNRVVIG